MSTNLFQNLSSIFQEQRNNILFRIEGQNYYEQEHSLEAILDSGYTLHLDLQELSYENRKTIWGRLNANTDLKKLFYNPFPYRRSEDQFGNLHEDYKISWLDWSGMLWSFFNHHWYKQSFYHPANYHIFRSSEQPELIMIRKLGNQQLDTVKPTHSANIFSMKFFNQTVNPSDNHFSKSPKNYHEQAKRKSTQLKAMRTSSASLIAIVTWFLVQYPPSTILFLTLLAIIGIPFLSFNIAMLAVISLISIIISIGINYIYTIMSPETDINFWHSLNKIMYNVAFFVVPLMIIICIPAQILNINLLIIAGIAALFALYHTMCLNDWYKDEVSFVSQLKRSLFGDNRVDGSHPTPTKKCP